VGRPTACRDLLIEAGKGLGLAPAGIIALDIARIEAGMIMLQVDYISSRKALIEAQKSSPFEIGLEWAVDLKKGDFVGRKALLAEKRAGSRWKLVGLEVDWESLQELYGRYSLVPQLSGRASRLAAPLYREEQQIGQATSHTFSPILKRYIAIACVESQQGTPGSQLQMEFTIEHSRQKAEAIIVKLPFFDPPRKRA
jgi:aminomethyltransferase